MGDPALKLKACPFCGGPGRFFYRTAGCVYGHAISPEMDTKKDAAAWWNRRKRPTPEARALSQKGDEADG